MMEEQIRARRLPPLFDGEVNAQNFDEWRKNIVDLYAHECFGVTPPAPREVRAVVAEQNDDDWAGKAEHRKVMLSFDMENGEFSFPVHLVIPKAGRPCPCVVYPSFTPYATAGYQPIEEIVDQGFALAVFCYEDVTRDNEDFTDGLAAMTYRGAADDWGKIGMWAFACSRVLDHLLTLPEIDGSRVAVLGHSRLGKTALWAAAQDLRFAAVHSNDSGCAGAAVCRGKVGESVQAIYSQFPFWFCENYNTADRKSCCPLSSISCWRAPRLGRCMLPAPRRTNGPIRNRNSCRRCWLRPHGSCSAMKAWARTKCLHPADASLPAAWATICAPARTI